MRIWGSIEFIVLWKGIRIKLSEDYWNQSIDSLIRGYNYSLELILELFLELILKLLLATKYCLFFPFMYILSMYTIALHNEDFRFCDILTWNHSMVWSWKNYTQLNFEINILGYNPNPKWPTQTTQWLILTPLFQLHQTNTYYHPSR